MYWDCSRCGARNAKSPDTQAVRTCERCGFQPESPAESRRTQPPTHREPEPPLRAFHTGLLDWSILIHRIFGAIALILAGVCVFVFLLNINPINSGAFTTFILGGALPLASVGFGFLVGAELINLSICIALDVRAMRSRSQ